MRSLLKRIYKKYNDEQFQKNKKIFYKDTPIDVVMEDAFIIQEFQDNNESLMSYLDQDRLS